MFCLIMSFDLAKNQNKYSGSTARSLLWNPEDVVVLGETVEFDSSVLKFRIRQLYGYEQVI